MQETAIAAAHTAIHRVIVDLLNTRTVLDAAFGSEHEASQAADQALDVAMLAKRAIGRVR